MVDTTISAANEVEVWERRFFTEYVRMNRFRRYMGTSPNDCININERLTREPGQKVTIQLVTRATGAGVSGNSTLKGNEEALGNFGHKIETTTVRNGIRVTEEEDKKSNIDILNAARPVLRDWAMEDLRGANGGKRGIIDAMGSVGVGVGSPVHFDDATEGQKDAWLDDNTDRLLFGDAKGNTVASDFSASLAAITAGMTLTSGVGSLAKRMAQTADPHIRPIKVGEDEEWYVMFCNSNSFRDLSLDPVVTAANREAWQRGRENPLFTGGDLLYDGIIYREVPEIPSLGAVGATAAEVGANFLCGAQAVGVGWAMRTTVRTDTEDYGFQNGVAVMEMRGVEKLLFVPGTGSTGIQHGMVATYAGAAPDA